MARFQSVCRASISNNSGSPTTIITGTTKESGDNASGMGSPCEPLFCKLNPAYLFIILYGGPWEDCTPGLFDVNETLYYWAKGPVYNLSIW